MPDVKWPRQSFPTAEEMAGCSEWCRPLHLIADAIAGQQFARYFVIEDFMCMGRLHRRGRPDLLLNKHRFTRRYLNLDVAGHAYRYLAPRSDTSGSWGRYLPYPDLVEAIDALDLHLLPWMWASGFEHDTRGLSWDERFEHPDVRAWSERRGVRR